MATKTNASSRVKFRTDRQRELMRVLTDCFKEFDRRQQHYYKLEGMSTAHVVVHAVQDFSTLQIFWPRDLVKVNHTVNGTSNTYVLKDNTMRKVQDAVRDTLKQLNDGGYLEKLGNEHERRWRPAK